MVVGKAPFYEANESETLTMILDCKFIIPDHVSPACQRYLCISGNLDILDILLFISCILNCTVYIKGQLPSKKCMKMAFLGI